MKVEFKGGKELEAALAELAKGAARRTAERALKLAAQPIRDEWAAGVDVQSSDLKNSIKIGKRQMGRSQRKFRRGAGQDIVTSYVGVDTNVADDPASLAIYSHIEEFGSDRQPANPAGRNAFESQKHNALNRLADDLRAEITKTAERAAKKAAKLAARG